MAPDILILREAQVEEGGLDWYVVLSALYI
jgi:hypothetical protein